MVDVDIEKPGESSGTVSAQEASWSRIHAALAPRIAVLCADDVDEVLKPNNVDTFADLLRPFQSSVENVAVRTSQLETRQCSVFPFVFEMLDDYAPSSSTSTSTDEGVFTPADLVNANESGESGSEKARRRTKKFVRPEVLLDAISARVSAKSKALWEIRHEDGSVQSPTEARSYQHRRRTSALYPRSAGLLLDNDLTEEENMDAEELDRYRSAPIDALMPWFADTRDMVYQATHISEHETFCHPVAIIIVISASSPDPMNDLATLYEASQANANAAFHKRPYIDPLVFRYYAVLHDISKDGPDLNESVQLLENVKKTYGLHCSLLPINSAANPGKEKTDVSKIWQRTLRSPGDVHMRQSSKNRSIDSWHGDSIAEDARETASLLGEEDVRRLKAFLRDFAVQSLIPFMERCVSLWAEQVAASRRGLTGRLLGAGRKLFGGSRISTQSTSTASFAQLGFYPHSSVEAQTRRLADFAFMTRDYRLAASMYDFGRKDYAADKAYRYLAGANEMFGLSYLMSTTGKRGQSIDVDSYLAAACQYYMLAPRQRGSALQIDGLRATLLYYDAYQGLRSYKMAPVALVRTANDGAGEAENDLEVVAAMLLEQAALSNLRKDGGAALRKCALHLMMAAHRYRTCGQKYLSLRCFQASAHCYAQLRNKSSGPVRTSDNGNDGDEGDGERIADLIARTEQRHIQHWNYIDDHMEFEIAQQALNDGRFSQAVVHYISLLQRSTGHDMDSEGNYAYTERHEAFLQGLMTSAQYLDGSLEEVLSVKGKEAALFIVDVDQTGIRSSASTQIDDDPWRSFEEEILGEAVSTSYKMRNTAAIGETFAVQVRLFNRLSIPVRLTDVAVSLEAQNGVMTVDATALHIEKKQSISLEPRESRSIDVMISVDSPCLLRCSAVEYMLEGRVPMREILHKKGQRLNETKEQRASMQPQYGPSPSLLVEIHESKAILEASLVGAPTLLGLGEEKGVQVRLINVGKASLRNLFVYLNRADTLLPQDGDLSSENGATQIDNSLNRMRGVKITLPNSEELSPGQEFIWNATMRGSALGTLTLRALFTYQPPKKTEALTAQLQHVLLVEPIIDLNVQAIPSRKVESVYDLRIDAVNLLRGEEDSQRLVTIDKIDFIAPLWTLDDAHPPDSIVRQLANIAKGELRTTHLQVKCAEPGPSAAEEHMRYVVQALDTLATSKNTAEVNAADRSLKVLVSRIGDPTRTTKPSLSSFLLAARREYRLASLSSEFPSLALSNAETIQKIFPLYEPRELDVVAHWRIVGDDGSQPDRHGQAFVFGLGLGPLHDYLHPLFAVSQDPALVRSQPSRTMYAETEREKAAIWSDLRKSRLHVDEDPVMLDFIVPDQIKASKVDGKPRFTFDVDLKICNLSSLEARDVIVDLENTTSASIEAPTICGSYIGRLTLRARLEPMMSTVLTAKVSTAKQGQIFLPSVILHSSRTDRSDDAGHRRREHCPKLLDVLVS
jgi:hypothetical protein